MSEGKLKPCPFCGGKPSSYFSGVDGDWVATCQSCEIWFDDVSREPTIKAWNTRPLEDELVTALEGLYDVETDVKERYVREFYMKERLKALAVACDTLAKAKAQ